MDSHKARGPTVNPDRNMPRDFHARFLILIPFSAFSLVSGIQAQEKKIPVTGLADADLAAFDEMMLKFMADNQVPGAALAVAKDGKLVYARGFGHADRSSACRCSRACASASPASPSRSPPP